MLLCLALLEELLRLRLGERFGAALLDLLGLGGELARGGQRLSGHAGAAIAV